MPFFTNPFRRDNYRTFPGVVIPLAQGHRPSLAPAEKESDPAKDEDKLAKVGSEENGTASLPETSTLTIEALRTEVEHDLASSGHDSAYDRMSFCAA